jgi:voltage-gated sodium channel
MAITAKELVEKPWFHRSIMAVIIINAILIGVETDFDLYERHKPLFTGLNWFFQAIYTLEIVLRMRACGPNYARFFKDGWNLFDFVIVAVAFLPATGGLAPVARLARLLRVARLISGSPQLKLIIATMLKSIPSMGHVLMLIALIMYIYGVLGCHLYHKADPTHWGTLGLSILTLFQLLTLEAWSDLQRTLFEHGHTWSWLFFVSYIVLAVFVVINLFIAVMINNLQDVKSETEAAENARHEHHETLQSIEELKAKLDRLENLLKKK